MTEAEWLGCDFLPSLVYFLQGQIRVPEGRPCFLARRRQANLVRDILGNPFRPVSVNASSVSPSVAALAHAAYEEHFLPSGELDPDRLAVLADALEEGDFIDPAILDHLRGAGPHMRGC